MESFEQLAKQYKPMIYKIIHSLYIYKNQEEFFQSGLIALWEASNRFDPAKGTFINYAYTYIKGFLQTELRKMNKQEEISIYPKGEYWDSVVDDSTSHLLEKEILQSYCETLTPNQQKWVFYTFQDFLTVQEIAEKEKVSLSAVKSWRAGAREKIRKMVIS